MSGLFGNLFDQATETLVLNEMLFENERTGFEESGLDADELEFMDSEKRREGLEEVGLDLDEYDF